MTSYHLGIFCVRILSNCRQLLLPVFKPTLVHFIISPGYSLSSYLVSPSLSIRPSLTNISQLMFPVRIPFL